MIMPLQVLSTFDCQSIEIRLILRLLSKDKNSLNWIIFHCLTYTERIHPTNVLRFFFSGAVSDLNAAYVSLVLSLTHWV